MRARALSISFRGRRRIAFPVGRNLSQQAWKKRPTSNAQHPTSNARRLKDDHREPAFPFFIERWRLDVERWTFLPPRFPPCAVQAPALTVRRIMRFFLRRACLTLATGVLIFCCSCERHHVGELPEHENPKAHSEGDATKAHSPASPVPRNSPANFFPDKPAP
jgi:hypothetical protein